MESAKLDCNDSGENKEHIGAVYTCESASGTTGFALLARARLRPGLLSC